MTSPSKLPVDAAMLAAFCDRTRAVRAFESDVDDDASDDVSALTVFNLSNLVEPILVDAEVGNYEEWFE